MVRFSVAFALTLALSACDTLSGYTVRVKDPTSRDTVQEQTYYDYGKHDTIHPQSGSYGKR